MKSILVLGAGRSSSSLITYLLQYAPVHDWHVTVGDLSQTAAATHVGQASRGTAIPFDISAVDESRAVIASADVVISLLPATLHPAVAALCLQEKKHLLTASYVSDAMRAMHADATAANLLFLNECGLDPGIDHMTAMQVIDRIRDAGGTLLSFESFTGGLIAPETDPGNPWRYKFTWNPRNVVMAGQGTARYLQEGQYKYIPYQQLFARTTAVEVPGFGSYEGYANRDSLQYIYTYGLQGVQTMLRGTMRNKGYCSAWNILVQLGCCDDSYAMHNVATMTHRDFVDSFLPSAPGQGVEERLVRLFAVEPQGPEMQRLRWSGLFDAEPVGLREGTPAQILEHILNKKWKLEAGDKDMIVMWHRFVFSRGSSQHEIQASLVAQGVDAVHTAMAKTVGLPLAIAAKTLLTGKIKARGVTIPITAELYEPILAELQTLGVVMAEREVRRA